MLWDPLPCLCSFFHPLLFLFPFFAPTYILHALIYYSTLLTSHLNQSCIWFSLFCLFLILHSNVYIFSAIPCVLYLHPFFHTSCHWFSLSYVFLIHHSNIYIFLSFCVWYFHPIFQTLSTSLQRIAFFPPIFSVHSSQHFALSYLPPSSLPFPVCPSFPGGSVGSSEGTLEYGLSLHSVTPRDCLDHPIHSDRRAQQSPSYGQVGRQRAQSHYKETGEDAQV